MKKQILTLLAVSLYSVSAFAAELPAAKKLYYTTGACSLASRIVANELGLKLEYEGVDLATHKTASTKDFYKINPKGAVPALELTNGQVLSEGAVIMQFLSDANGFKLLEKTDDLNRYRTLEGVNYISTELHKSIAMLFAFKGSDATMPKAIVDKKLSQLNKMLEGNKSGFFVGDKFTIADAYLATVLRWPAMFGIDIAKYSNVSKYHKNILNRPSIKQSLSEEGLV